MWSLRAGLRGFCVSCRYLSEWNIFGALARCCPGLEYLEIQETVDMADLRKLKPCQQLREVIVSEAEDYEGTGDDGEGFAREHASTLRRLEGVWFPDDPATMLRVIPGLEDILLEEALVTQQDWPSLSSNLKIIRTYLSVHDRAAELKQMGYMQEIDYYDSMEAAATVHTAVLLSLAKRIQNQYSATLTVSDSVVDGTIISQYSQHWELPTSSVIEGEPVQSKELHYRVVVSDRLSLEVTGNTLMESDTFLCKILIHR